VLLNSEKEMVLMFPVEVEVRVLGVSEGLGLKVLAETKEVKLEEGEVDETGAGVEVGVRPEVLEIVDTGRVELSEPVEAGTLEEKDDDGDELGDGVVVGVGPEVGLGHDVLPVDDAGMLDDDDDDDDTSPVADETEDGNGIEVGNGVR
jgi:hypothetical protein